jgi:hypothetical protein
MLGVIPSAPKIKNLHFVQDDKNRFFSSLVMRRRVPLPLYSGFFTSIP